MHRNFWRKEFTLVCLALATLTCGAATADAAVIMTEDFETPAIAIPGATTPTLPSGWVTNNIGLPEIWRPGPLAVGPRWNQAEPMAAPAGGNQILFLDAWEGIYKQAATIAPNTTYTLSAAIGSDLAIVSPLQWSLQMYADLNDDGQLDPGDFLLSQQYGGSGTEAVPAPGDWVTNSTSFDSALIDPNLLGRTLLVLLFNTTNSSTSTSSYDNVTVTAVTVPEPSTVALGLCAAVGFGCLSRRRFGTGEFRT